MDEHIHLHTFTDYAAFVFWHEGRLGASSVGYILGLSDYMSPHAFWEKSMKLVEDENDIYEMNRGQAKEDAIARLFAQSSGERVISKTAGYRSFTNDKIPPFICASPDRELFAKGRAKRPLLECKDTRKHIPELTPRTCPAVWMAQMQVQMHICERDMCYIAAEEGGKNLVWMPLMYSREAAEEIIEYCATWWERHIIGEEEPPLEARDAKDFYPFASEGTIKQVENEYLYIKEEIMNKKKRLKSLTKEIEHLTDKLRLACGETEIIQAGGTPICKWSNTMRTQFDEKKFAEEHPKLYVQYKKEEAARRLIIL